MNNVFLTKRIEFSASHRYHNPAWSPERNRDVFGACNNACGHGHNYLLEVTVGGAVAPETGMVVNLYDLQEVLEQVLAEFDHKHLNLDTPYFSTRIPTTENIAGVLWGRLTQRHEIGRLETVRLFEDEDLYAEVSAPGFDANGDLRQATLARRYHFAAAHRPPARSQSPSGGGCSDGLHGHNYELEIALSGPVSPETGMVTDIGALDRHVADTVLAHVAGCDLSAAVPGHTGEQVVHWMWERVASRLPGGRLSRLRLMESREVSYEVSAAGYVSVPASGR